MKPMTPMTMAMRSMLAFRKPKGKNCCVKGVSLSTNAKCCSKNKHNCFWNDSNNCCCWNSHDCSGSNSIAFKTMLTLEWSESQEDNNCLNDKLLKLTFSRASNNNKPNRWMRMRKEKQMQFLRPWSSQILNSFILANNNKRSKSVCVMNVLIGNVGEECHANIGRTPQGFDLIAHKSTRMHARLNCRCSCAVDPCWTRNLIVARKAVEN